MKKKGGEKKRKKGKRKKKGEGEEGERRFQKYISLFISK